MPANPNLLVANWKMNLSAEQSTALAREVRTLAHTCEKTEIWLAPSFTAIPATASACSGTRVRVGAQNVHWAGSGAFTGEISLPMLREFGCTFSLIGHSERRHLFAESPEMVIQRALAALAQLFDVIFCVGESLEERKSGRTEEVLATQLGKLFDNLSETAESHVTIAYEPVWAIGTGIAATTAEIHAAHGEIARLWRYGRSSKYPPILYGGSVSAENYADILSIPNVAGALVGKASLAMDSFAELARISESL